MTTDRTINVPELRKQLEYITAHRTEWLQSNWIYRTACGTVGCLAGNTVINAGYVPVFYGGDNCTTSQVSTHRIRTARDAYDANDAGELWSVRELASELLGLSDEEAEELFNANNSLHDVWSIAARFTGGEIEVPPDVEVEDAAYRPVPDGQTVVNANYAARDALRIARNERVHLSRS